MMFAVVSRVSNGEIVAECRRRHGRREPSEQEIVAVYGDLVAAAGRCVRRPQIAPKRLAAILERIRRPSYGKATNGED